jgi:pimeloyl-ACP methyl ester carboxylesterase
VLEDLKQRLAATRFPQQIENTGWSYGADLATIRELVTYWKDEYDWRVHEAALNRFPQFTTVIDDQRIHFIHARSKHADATPIILMHGWPGSVVEFMDVIDPLTDPEAHGGTAEDAFHVVAPSLPGYGFSEATKSTGYDCYRIAQDFAALMARLGYDDYGAEGGDWGAIIGNNLAILDAEHVRGYHTTMPLAFPPAEGAGELSDVEKTAIADMAAFEQNGTGYQKIQGTKPQTLGFGLTDSPAGLCAWITEKFHAWTDCDGHPENVLDRDELLDNVMLYWLTASGASSARLYWESFGNLAMDPVSVPTGCSIFPKELIRPSRRWAEKRFTNIVYWNELEKGGHFAAFEQPESFVEELRACFRHMR